MGKKILYYLQQWRPVLLQLLPLFFLSTGIQANDLSQYAAEDKAVDELIVNAANSTSEFEFFYDEKEKLLKLEYDMVYSMEEWEALNSLDTTRKKRAAAVVIGSKGANRWTNAKIPYEFSEGVFEADERKLIESAMAAWSKHTCLNFVEDANAKDRLFFKDSGGCMSRVGMVGGKQSLGLGKTCRLFGVVLHEMGHAIGLHHEQTRPDRDDHVTIVYKNIPSPMKFNFQKFNWSTVKDLNIPYDYSSIMHYGKNSFSFNGKPTIVTVDPAMQDTIGQKKGLSFRDIKTVNVMYNCKKARPSCTKTDSDCPGEGFVGKDCQCWCPGSPIQLCARGGGNKDGGGKPLVKKTKTTSKEKECEDQHKSCPYWAKSGECEKNPAYMNVYCQMSCNTCSDGKVTTTQKTTQVKPSGDSCKDLHASCTYWTGKGFCSHADYRVYMGGNCRKSCGLCNQADTSGECKDNNNQCQVWSLRDECQTNPAYMKKECRLSCGLCQAACKDKNLQCKAWSLRGECQKNPAYMNKECRLACGLCYAVSSDTVNACRDKKPQCEAWSKIGECQRNALYMDSVCRQSCGLCNTASSGSNAMMSAYGYCVDKNKDCPAWAKEESAPRTLYT